MWKRPTPAAAASTGDASRSRYLASLPERALRSASAIAGGLVRELAGVVLPAGIRRTKLYRTLVDATLRFLVEQVGGVEQATPPGEEQLAGDFLIRRAAGNGLELVGLLTFRASPVWVLAALADLSGAGRQLIQEISESLKKEGLLDPQARFETMDQLLDGLEATSGQLADTINAPPLDIPGLRKDWDALRRAASRLPKPGLPRADDIRRRWNNLTAEAAAQNRSVFDLSSVMALSAMQRLSRAGGFAARRTVQFYSGALMDHYDVTLREIRAKGFFTYWREEFRPYLKAAATQFSPQRKSFTERWLER
jgi:hypothetical protein